MNFIAQSILTCLLVCGSLAAAAPTAAPDIKRIPPAGVPVPEKDRKSLEAGVAELGKEIDALRTSLKSNPALLDLLPDVQIYHNAVRYALTYDEFVNTGQIKQAQTLLAEGMDRAKSLREGQAPWTKKAGIVVRGYLSKIDNSIQPYGLVIPPAFETDPAHPRRLDVWFHGRGETLNEISFLTEHEKSPGQFTPADTFVLHPYGRYCNANRFAGEVDTFEALDNVRTHYTIDPNRVLVRGFSMGGAACWLFATHHPSEWAGAAPGAGFTETQNFLHITDLSTVPWYQQKLWHLYDSTDYAVNLFNCPTVAYSGEADPQKQAADEMTKAMASIGLKLEHLIGPDKTKHAYHPKTKLEVAKRVDELAAAGRDEWPKHVKFTTWSLKYNRSFWVQVDGLARHWERAFIDATRGTTIELTTSNVTALSIYVQPDPHIMAREFTIKIDGQAVPPHNAMPRVTTSGEAVLELGKSDGNWAMRTFNGEHPLRKRHDLQGPIDDAFMSSFVMVRPTGKPLSQQTAAWAAGEMNHAITQWRSVFRGEAPVKDDTTINDNDISSSNLILWGDPSSNAVVKKIVDKLPIRWTAQSLEANGKTYPAGSYVPILIYPNPLNPAHYIVLNSGHTFREADLVNNARQTPKLPDWAIVDTAIPASAQSPGGIVDAGFFGEKWEWLGALQQK